MSHLSPFGNHSTRSETRVRAVTLRPHVSMGLPLRGADKHQAWLLTNLYRLNSWELYSQQRHSPPPGSERQLECSRAASERLQGAAPLGCHSS